MINNKEAIRTKKLELRSLYEIEVQKFEKQLLFLNFQLKKNSFIRIILFVVGVGLTIYLTTTFGFKGLWSIVVWFSIFLFFVKQNLVIQKKRNLTQELRNVNIREINALDNNFDNFENGNEFIDYNHQYSNDIDIFGDGSLFQAINRCCTGKGKKQLADWLSKLQTKKDDIIQRQEAVKELRTLFHWRQNFFAQGLLLQTKNEAEQSNYFFQAKPNFPKNAVNNDIITDEEALQFWLQNDNNFFNTPASRFFLTLIPIISVLLILFTSFNFLNGNILIFWFIALLGFSFYFVKKINFIHNQVGKKVLMLNKYAALLNMLENKTFSSKYLQQLSALLVNKNESCSKSLKKLALLVNALDNRLNLLFSIVANGFFLWDLQVVSRLQKWKVLHKENVMTWFDTIAKTDALLSMSAYAYNNPEFVFPEILEGNFYFEAQAAGHPLLHFESRVNNNFSITAEGKFAVVTGANMAGKSTFLRTIGTNLVLALSGNVCCAEKLVLSPMKLLTSIRLTDSLQKNESYFFAELKRLKFVIDAIDNNFNTFVIIDEMLRGTNSKDKHLGSVALLEQLIKLGASGIIATHDVALGDLKISYPNQIENFRFEVDIQNDELNFPYTILEGVSRNLNATILMKKMGITI